MENYLYLLELFVETVTFSSNLPEYPRAHEVVIMGEMGSFPKMDVFTIRKTLAEDEPHKEMELNCGKSILFAIQPDDLLNEINLHPFEINLYVNKKYVAGVNLGWTKDFYTLVKQAPEANGVLGPVTMQDQFLLNEKGTDRIMGDIKASVKLSSFGNSIKTSFQLVSTSEDANKKYLVRGARGETTFECQKLNEGDSGEVIPLTSLLSPAERSPTASHIGDEQMSFMAVFKSAIDPQFSVTPNEFNVAITSAFAQNFSNMTFDIVSLRERPEENKYVDLRIRGGSKGFLFEFDPPKFRAPKDDDNTFESSESVLEEEELTVEKINKMLCKNKDCPAVKKFKEFGIGPLAKTRGLGGLYGEPSLPITYGISQTYGVFDEYGPYGLFSRPKRPSDPFIPKQDNDWSASCWKPKRRKSEKTSQDCDCKKCSYNICHCQPDSSPLRLNGGNIAGLGCYEGYEPLRLSGGGVLDYEDVKSPFHECKEVMDQFDEVLRKYKKALGPCGKTTCPFAPNVTKETCKQLCKHDVDVYSIDEPLQKEECHKTEAPRKAKSRLKSACGSPKCAYAKYKSGLTDEDAEMELQYLPAPTSGKCGHPKCPSPVELDLPPIHWDCPDPLPKDRCKNPDCPYLPKEIKCLNAVLAKGPCGNFNCPFSPPPPCSSPNCPFGSKECPYQQQQADAESICDNVECPFAPKSNSLCENPECPFSPKKDICDNPTCPYVQPPPCPYVRRPSPCYVPPCGDSPCPYMFDPCLPNLMARSLTPGTPESLQLCFGGPDCPYTRNPDVCLSPNCPFQRPKAEPIQKKTSPCYIPVESPCGNPNCPHVKKDSPTCPMKSKEPREVIDGDYEFTVDTRVSVDMTPCSPGVCKAKGGKFECQECNQKHIKTNDICENPECPYAPKTCFIKPPPCYEPPKDDTCDNPECPFAPKPPCPMTLPPCVNPLQALLSYCLPLSICPEGVCPYPTRDMLQICFGGPECPYIQPAPSPPCMMEEKGDKDDEICENPECPYATDLQSDKCTLDLPEGIEYHSETRVDTDNAPCTSETCKAHVGDLVCAECSGGGDLPEGIEYKSDTRLSVDMAPCTKKTCKSRGGGLVCDVCQSGDKGTKSGPTIGGKQKKKKRKARRKYIYSLGDKYPGVQIGHRECVMPAFNVPPTMGWLWNIFTPCLSLKPRRGWRPGAITKTIAERIRKHREAQGLQMLELRDLRKGKKGYGPYDSETSVNVQPKPTLHIKKHDGCYWITMNPLKDPNSLVENESPYMDCTPLQFKIVKNKDKQKAEKENEEYTSCFCGDEVEEQSSSSSDSELEIEFTPPAGIIHPERFKKKKNVVHCDTQYMATDFETKSEKSGKKEKKGKKDKGKKGKGKKGKKKK